MSFTNQDRPFRRCLSEAERLSILRAHRRFIGLGSASTGHWPINRRCANTLCAYGYDRCYLLKLIIGLGSASTGHWPINRRCANTLCAYGVWPILVGKNHYRPGERIDRPLADKSAMRQYIVRLRGMTDLGW